MDNNYIPRHIEVYLMSNNEGECRKLSEHEKEVLRLCMELATQSYIPFEISYQSVRIQRLAYLASLFTFMAYICLLYTSDAADE